MSESPVRCSTCGVALVGGVTVADGVHAGVWVGLLSENRDAIRARDWSRAGELFASDVQMTSYQTGLAYRTMSRQEEVHMLRGIYDRESEFRFDILDVRGRWCLFRLHSFGPADDASGTGAWERGRIFVVCADAEGMWAQGEIYDEAGEQRARARFEDVAGA